MKAIIGCALVALGLASTALAQEQERFPSFARIGGRFVALQTVALDSTGPSSAFRLDRVRAEETARADEPNVRGVAVGPARLPQAVGAKGSSAATQPAAARLGLVDWSTAP